MFTREYLESIVKKYGCADLDLDKCQLLLNQMRISDKECPNTLTAKMLRDMLCGKKTTFDIIDLMGKASRYNDMLALHNCLKDMMIDYRNKAIEAKENGDTEKAEDFQRKADTYREKVETAWAMLEMSGATLTHVKFGDQYTWVVDLDRVW